jgi:crossover junction endodeoxyribonuclease RuvC
MLILGIDPGTATTGFGVINSTSKGEEVVEFGLISTENNGHPGKRLIDINKQITALLKKVNPEVIAIEKLFFATNIKTAMSVGQAIGVIMYTIARANISLIEYAPGTIKKAISGNGRADKKEMQKAVRKILGAKVRSRVHEKTHFDNSADALAVALCHAYNIKGRTKEVSK